jgi:hypothetical protein
MRIGRDFLAALCRGLGEGIVVGFRRLATE